ncbi:MAG: ThiF family adenylyltransferase [Sulfurospirillum sp.]|nr:ThiF family adenylyltransferase [Sulfurospirillum sp.]
MQTLKKFLEQKQEAGFFSHLTCKAAMQRFSLTCKEVELYALELGITPLRYKRNQSTISCAAQKQLLLSHVAIIGCGGLGGHVGENLARIGVGSLCLFDFDIFEEHNLNRQNFSNFAVIGEQKVTVVSEQLQKINPALHIKTYAKAFDVQKDFALIESCDAIIDALDDPKIKLALSLTCKQKNKIFIHGAIGGFNAQHATCNSLENLYKTTSKGIETSVGNPSFTVTYAAALQSAECIKSILGLGENLQNKILLTNLLENEFIILDN